MIGKKTAVKNLECNNIFYYDEKIYITGGQIRGDGAFSAMNCYNGTHQDFKPETMVLLISPEFIRDINILIDLFKKLGE